RRARAGGQPRRVAGRGGRCRLGRSRRRVGRGLLGDRGARGAARRGGRMLARGDQRRLAAAHRPGRPDGHEDLAGDLHRLRDQRCDPAHGRLQGRQAAARDQSRRRGVDLHQRRLRGDRRSARGRAGDLERDPESEGLIGVVIAAVVLAALIAVSATLFVVRLQFLLALLHQAAPVSRSGAVERRIGNEATIVLGQRKLLQRIGPGLIHAFIFWGFLVLAPTILIALIGFADKHSTLPWLGHQGWFAFLADIFATLVVIGCAGAVWIRKVQRPERFKGSHLGEADLILALIATIATALLLWQACRIALGLNEWPPSAAPVSDLLSHLFGHNSATRGLERVFVYLPVGTILFFLAYLPRSKHLHILSAAFNVWYGRTGPGGKLETLRFDDPDVPEEEIRFGAGTAADLTWKEMLETFSCTECGRCQDACPAFATGKTLSPKLVIMGLRDQLFADGASLVHARAGGGGAGGSGAGGGSGPAAVAEHPKPIDLTALVPNAVP